MARTKGAPLSVMCGRKLRRGREGTCRQLAGWGTSHPGEGACVKHGGHLSPEQYKHGLYSKITHPRIQALLDAHAEAHKDPSDLLPELALLRALTADYIERYTKFSEALIAWHESYRSGENTNPKPVQILDLADAARIVERVARVVDTMKRLKDADTISLGTLRRIMEAMGIIVARHVESERVVEAIEADWHQIQVTPESQKSLPS